MGVLRDVGGEGVLSSALVCIAIGEGIVGVLGEGESSSRRSEGISRKIGGKDSVVSSSGTSAKLAGVGELEISLDGVELQPSRRPSTSPSLAVRNKVLDLRSESGVPVDGEEAARRRPLGDGASCGALLGRPGARPA